MQVRPDFFLIDAFGYFGPRRRFARRRPFLDFRSQFLIRHFDIKKRVTNEIRLGLSIVMLETRRPFPDKTQDDYFASADQALYVANGGSVFAWAGPGNNNPTQVATTLDDPSEVARVLYWSYLCRQPTSDEIAMVTEQLDSAGDQRNAIIQEMAWSLLASAEFRFTR